MAILWGCGRDSIPGGVLEARIFLSGSALELVHSSDSAGAGQHGVLIGMAAFCAMVAAVMPSIAMRSMTETLTSTGTSEAVCLLRVVTEAFAVTAARAHAEEPEVSPELAQEHLADSIVVGTCGAFLREEGPASAAGRAPEGAFTVAAARRVAVAADARSGHR